MNTAADPIADMRHYADLLDFADAALRLLTPDDEETRSDLHLLRDHAKARMEEIWAGAQYECARREAGDDLAALWRRLGCETLIEAFGWAYRHRGEAKGPDGLR